MAPPPTVKKSDRLEQSTEDLGAVPVEKRGIIVVSCLFKFKKERRKKENRVIPLRIYLFLFFIFH